VREFTTTKCVEFVKLLCIFVKWHIIVIFSLSKLFDDAHKISAILGQNRARFVLGRWACHRVPYRFNRLLAMRDRVNDSQKQQPSAVRVSLKHGFAAVLHCVIRVTELILCSDVTCTVRSIGTPVALCVRAAEILCIIWMPRGPHADEGFAEDGRKKLNYDFANIVELSSIVGSLTLSAYCR
jgi:hypothetical protein